MSLFGRNDQSVTANSTTTKATTTGAPLGTHDFVKGAKNSGIPMTPNSSFGNTSPGSAASIAVNMFNNSTPGAFINNQSVGIFGVSATEMGNNVTNKAIDRPAHAGWVIRRGGTGGIVSITYSGTATGYNNTDVITISSPQAGGNATASVSTNATGGALFIAITNPGRGFFVINATANVAIANATGGASGGSGATFAAVAGGRAGRVHTETLVAMGSLGAQTANYGIPASVSDSATDNSKYPGT